MRLISCAFFALLAVYSAVLIALEFNTSQDYIRHYFSDIEGPRPFFAINTTLSTFLLAGGAMLLAFTASAGHRPISGRLGLFLWSQAGMLGFLAFDDRFQLHEALAYRIGIGDHFIMATWALIEAVLLLSLARLAEIPFRAFMLVAIGGAFFAVMMVFDAIVPHDMVLRLSLEDIAKSWAAALFFAGCWVLARFHLGFSQNVQTLADRIGPLMRYTLQPERS